MSKHYVGLDLGQMKDYTALAVLEVGNPPPGTEHPAYNLRHLERIALHTSYPEIVERVKALMDNPALVTFTPRPTPARHDPVAIADWHRCPHYEKRPDLVVDATGVGVAVRDMLRDAGLHFTPVSITGGDTATYDAGTWRVPKRDLVAAVQVLLQSSRLKFAAGMQHVDTLTRELLNFQVKINPQTAHDSYGAWREGTHDDLVLAVALAAWKAERKHGPKRRTGGMF